MGNIIVSYHIFYKSLIRRVAVRNQSIILLSVLLGVMLTSLTGCSTKDPRSNTENQTGSENLPADGSATEQTATDSNSNAAIAAQLTVAVIPDYPPFSFDENGEPKGICIDILNEVSIRTGIDIAYEMTPFNRALENVKEGVTDAMTPIYKTVEREAYLDFTAESLVPDSNSFFVRSDANIQFDGNFSTLKDYTIGLVFNNSFGTDFDTAVSKGTLKTEGASNIDGIIKKLIGKRQDIIIGGTYPVLYISKTLGVGDQIKALTPPVSNEFIVMCFTKKTDHTTTIKRINDTLKEMKADGTIEQIISTYE